VEVRGTFRFGTVTFSLVRRSELRALVRDWTDACTTSRTMTLTGAHGVAESRAHADVQRAHDDADYVLCDGTPPWLGGVLRGHRRAVDRIPGRDAMREIAASAASAGVRQAFIGGPPGLAERTQAGLERAIGMPIIGTAWSPPFVDRVDDAYADAVADRLALVRAPAIVWIGLSTPKQELLALHLKHRLPEGYFFIAVGAAFDMYAGTRRATPTIISRVGMEWLYRSIQEPRRLPARYARALPTVVGALGGAARDRLHGAWRSAAAALGLRRSASTD
jgi:N-acetylglucosaminyldiphosphoundecaprenol N-acetyl-beta-D-mannosaminyltransferase